MTPQNAIYALEILGDIAQYALPTGAALYAIQKGETRAGLSLVLTAAIQQVVLNTLKKYIIAPRPFPNHERLDSFPSGHTAGAFLSVGLISAIPCVGKAAKTALLAASLLVGLSRYLCSMHHPIDIAAGCAIGLIFGSLAGCMKRVV
jgi:membrane-associated phospholipid phosphatase